MLCVILYLPKLSGGFGATQHTGKLEVGKYRVLATTVTRKSNPTDSASTAATAGLESPRQGFPAMPSRTRVFFFQCAHIVTVYDMVSSSYRFATPKPSSVARRALPGALSFQGCMNLQDWGKL